ncbi:MAG: DUF1990 domain-containing protein [Streptosporangiaceae bacterium]
MDFTYPEVGATRTGVLPAGYTHLDVRMLLGNGPEVFRRAAESLMTFQMHRAIPVKITTSAPRAVEGATVTVTLAGLVRAPCRIIWTRDEARTAAWAYGTLRGHPEIGEESFVVEHRDDDTVWLVVTAFARAGNRLARLATPLIPLMQRLYARRCGAVLRKHARN